MKKEIKNKKIFYTCKEAHNFERQYTWGEVKEALAKANIELLDTDELRIHYEDGWQEGDSARDNMYAISVHRYIEETDEEFERRVKRAEENKERNKKQRYENYLKLKKEFENV